MKPDTKANTLKIPLQLFLLLINNPYSVTFNPLTMNFYDVVFPLHFMSKLSGITIFSIESDSLTTKIRKFDVILLCVTAFVNFYLNRVFWNNYAFTSHFQSEIIKTSLPILLYGKFWINIIWILWSIFRRKKIAKILTMIQEVDEMVNGKNYRARVHHVSSNLSFRWRR